MRRDVAAVAQRGDAFPKAGGGKTIVGAKASGTRLQGRLRLKAHQPALFTCPVDACSGPGTSREEPLLVSWTYSRCAHFFPPAGNPNPLRLGTTGWNRTPARIHPEVAYPRIEDSAHPTPPSPRLLIHPISTTSKETFQRKRTLPRKSDCLSQEGEGKTRTPGPGSPPRAEEKGTELGWNRVRGHEVRGVRPPRGPRRQAG